MRLEGRLLGEKGKGPLRRRSHQTKDGGGDHRMDLSKMLQLLPMLDLGLGQGVERGTGVSDTQREKLTAVVASSSSAVRPKPRAACTARSAEARCC